MKSNPIVTGDRSLIEIRYKYNYWKVLRIISTEWYGDTDPGFPYLYCYPENYFDVSTRHVL